MEGLHWRVYLLSFCKLQALAAIFEANYSPNLFSGVLRKAHSSFVSPHGICCRRITNVVSPGMMPIWASLAFAFVQ